MLYQAEPLPDAGTGKPELATDGTRSSGLTKVVAIYRSTARTSTALMRENGPGQTLRPGAREWAPTSTHTWGHGPRLPRRVREGPVIEEYKKHVDRTFLREHLKRSVTERFENLMRLERFDGCVSAFEGRRRGHADVREITAFIAPSLCLP